MYTRIKLLIEKLLKQNNLKSLLDLICSNFEILPILLFRFSDYRKYVIHKENKKKKPTQFVFSVYSKHQAIVIRFETFANRVYIYIYIYYV